MLTRRLKDCEEIIAGDGSLLRELLHPDRANVAIRYSLAHATVKPGEGTLAHRLATAEVYYILQGTGTMFIDDKCRPVEPGSTIYIPPGAAQYIQNTGDDDLLFLCIVEPAWRRQDEEILKD